MHVLRLHQGGDLRLHDEPAPEPKPGEVLLRVAAVGICGSDLHWFEDAGIGDDRLSHPLVLGHEFAAVIEEGEHRGQLVAVDPAVPCGRCVFCQEGDPNLCENTRFSGHSTQDGALRERMAWPEECLFPLPEDFTAADGAMLEPLGVALHAVDLGKVKPGMTVGVFGSGPIGLLVIQVARAAGATRIVATDTRPHRLEAARAFGATDAFPAVADGSEGDEIWKVLRQGVDVAFEAAGDNKAVQAAIDAVRPGGQVVLIGIPSEDQTSFRASTARRKGLTIKLARRMKHVYPRAIALVRRGLVDVRGLVTHQYPLEQYEEAFATALRRDGLKVVVEPDHQET